MKQLLLLVANLSVGQEDNLCARDLFLRIYKGETIALVGELDSGRQGFADYLCGEVPRQSGVVRFGGCADSISAERMLQQKTFRSVGTRFLFHRKGRQEKITLVEYLFLMRRDGCRSMLWNRSRLNTRARLLLAQVGLERDPLEDIAALSPMECCLLNVAKAIDSGAELVVLEEDFEGYTVQDIKKLALALEKIKQQGLSFVLNMDGLRGVETLADRCFLFRGGSIAKKGGPPDLRQEPAQWMSYLGETEAPRHVAGRLGEVILEADGLPAGEHTFDLQVHEGELLHVVDYDIRRKNQLFRILAGWEPAHARLLYRGRPLPRGWAHQRGRYPVVALDMLGGTALFGNLTVQQNLVFPSLRKICGPGGWLPPSAVLNAAEQEWDAPRRPMPASLEELTPPEKLALQMESWYIYHPEVLILLEPFLHLDHAGRQVLLQSFERLRRRGTAVVVFSSSHTSYLGSHKYEAANWYDRMVDVQEVAQ